MESLVYIILINYNTKAHTIECLKSLANLNYNNYKIVVVDNNSEDSDFSEVQAKYSNVHIINNSKNYGFAGANNIGIKYALKNNADYVLLLNNDTIVDKDFLRILVNESKKNEEIAICTSKILYYDLRNRIWYGGGNINYFKGNSQIYNFNEESSISNKNMYCNFASGCCMLIKSNALRKVGLMNEEYFLYYEDVDYCVKFLKEGYKIYYVSSSIVFHKESISTQKYSYLYQYYFARNRLLFIKRNLKAINKITAYPISILWLLYKILKGTFNFKPCIEGIKDFIFRRFGKRG